MTLLAAAVAGLASLAAADTQFSYEASLRDEIRTRPAQPPPADPANTPSTTIDDSLIPTLSGTLTSDVLLLHLTYDPQILFVDPYEEWNPQVLERGRADLTLGSSTSRTKLLLVEEGQYGYADFLVLTNGLTGPNGTPLSTLNLGPLPPIVAILYAYWNNLAMLTQVLTPRLSFDLSGGYVVSGGDDTSSKEVMPLQSGPFANADIFYDLTQRDRLTTTLQASDTYFDGPLSAVNRIALIQLQETWRRALKFDQELSGTVGAAAVVLKLTGQTTYEERGYPVLIGDYTQRVLGERERKLDLRIDASIAPYIDRLNGLDYERASVTFTLKARLRKEWSVSVDEGAAVGLWGDGIAEGVPLDILGASLKWEPNKWFTGEVGWRGFGQLPDGGIPASFSWIGYLAGTVHYGDKL